MQPDPALKVIRIARVIRSIRALHDVYDEACMPLQGHSHRYGGLYQVLAGYSRASDLDLRSDGKLLCLGAVCYRHAILGDLGDAVAFNRITDMHRLTVDDGERLLGIPQDPGNNRYMVSLNFLLITSLFFRPRAHVKTYPTAIS